MKVIITSVGTLGDIKPLTSIGELLIKNGHSVLFLTNSKFEKDVRKKGLEFCSIGSEEELDEGMAVAGIGASFGNITNILRTLQDAYQKIFINPVRLSYDYICKEYEQGNTVLIGNQFAFGPRFAQDKLGIPMLTVWLTAYLIRSDYRPPQLSGFSLPSWMPKRWNNVIPGMITWGFEKFIVKPVAHRLNYPDIKLENIAKYEWTYSPDKIIGLFPTWFAKPQPDWPKPLELTDFPFFDVKQDEKLTPELEEFVSAGEPPIVFTPGSYTKNNKSFFEESARACQMLGKRGIFVAPSNEEISERLPECVRYFKYVSFNALFPRAAAVVHHGGMGTTAQVLQSGKPHLIVPTFPDHFDTVSRLKELEVADTLTWKQYKAEKVAEKLGKLINSKKVNDNCLKTSVYFKQNTCLEDICRIVEELGTGKKSYTNTK